MMHGRKKHEQLPVLVVLIAIIGLYRRTWRVLTHNCRMLLDYFTVLVVLTDCWLGSFRNRSPPPPPSSPALYETPSFITAY